MKICITAGAPGLDAPLDPRVGRCAYFVIVETDSMEEVESISNTSAGAAGGAGIQAAQTIANTGASALITGNVGPNAVHTLSAAGVKIYLDQGGTVREVAERFKQGELKEISSASAPPHAGMGGGQGTGRGGGGGGGRGGGGRGGQNR